MTELKPESFLVSAIIARNANLRITPPVDATMASVPWAMELAAAVLRGRWKCGIVRLIQSDRCHFTEIIESLPGLSPKVLAHHLRDLEAAQLITRCTSGPRATHVSYELTDLGTLLGRILEGLEAWGALYANTHPSAVAQHGLNGLVVALRRSTADTTAE